MNNDNEKKKKKKIRGRELIKFVVLIVLAIWVINTIHANTAEYFSTLKLKKDVLYRIQALSNSSLEERLTQEHLNNSNYTFDIDEAIDEAETDINNIIRDETDYIIHANSLYGDYEWLRKYKLIKVYSIFNYKGDIVLEASELGDEFKDRKSEILVVEGSSFSDANRVDYTCANGKIIVDYDISNPLNSYTVAVVNKKSVSENANAVVSNIQNSIKHVFNNMTDMPDVENGNFLVRNYLIERLFRHKPLMIMVSSGDDDIDEEIKQYCVDSAIHFVEADLKGSGMTITSKDIKVVSETEFILRYKLLKFLYPNDEQIPYVEGDYDNSIHSHSYAEKYRKLYFVGYYTFSDLESTLMRTKARANKNIPMVFSKEDVFHFENFGSPLSYGGNCAGIAYYTMKLFNDGNVDTKGQTDFDSWKGYEFNEDGCASGIVEWDISKDKENEQLLSREINDYNCNLIFDHKAEYVINKKSGETKCNLVANELSPYENEFVNMIGCYWFEQNKARSQHDFNKDYGDYWDFQLIQDVMDYLDKDKIVQVGFSLNEKTDHGFEIAGHSVNIYDYVVYDENHIELYIYDSNYGDHCLLTERDYTSWKKTYEFDVENNIVGMHNYPNNFKVMHIEKKNINGRDVFLYDYYLDMGHKLLATNRFNCGDIEDNSYRIQFNDEDFNFFNLKYMD